MEWVYNFIRRTIDEVNLQINLPEPHEEGTVENTVLCRVG